MQKENKILEKTKDIFKETFGIGCRFIIIFALTLVNLIVLIISMYTIFSVTFFFNKGNILDGIESLIYVLIVLVFMIRSYFWILGGNRGKGALKYLVYISVIFAFHFLPTAVKKVSDIDTCLDFGGRWSYEKNGCECSRVKSLNIFENKELCPEAEVANKK